MARRKGPQVEQAFEYIKHKILSFEIAPGEAISDNSIAQELDMSRSPVREAMLRLEAEGLIQYSDTGAVCTELSLHDVEEICQVRTALETLAVSLIMERGGLSDRQKETLTAVYNDLAATLNDPEDARGLSGNYARDDEFHSTIVEFAQNERLAQILSRMRLQISRARWLNMVLPQRRTEAGEEHRAIYDALMAGDQKRAEEAMAQHQRNTAQNFRKVLSSPQYRMIFSGIRSICPVPVDEAKQGKQ